MSAPATSSEVFELLNRLSEDFIHRLRNDEHPSADEYTTAHPELADRIRRLFPALVAVEQAGSAACPGSTDEVARQSSLPRQLGNYQLLRELGRGGMGVVFEAVQAPLGRHVALKVLAGHAPTDLAVERFRREAEVAAGLHHTNIVSVFEAGQDGDTHYYAMQYIPGCSLHQAIEQLRARRPAGSISPADTAVPSPTVVPQSDHPGGLTILHPHLPRRDYYRRVAELGVQAASALAHAHEHGVYHRDIKPSNLLLDVTGIVWVTDFGLVKTPDGDLTGTGAMVGTLRYLAPERLAGQCDGRSDIYSLGLTLYELLTFEPAFPETDQAQLIQAIPDREPVPPRHRDSGIPRDLETVILKAVHKAPARRYQMAEAMADDLRRFLAGEPIRARRRGLLERTWGWAQRHPAPASLCCAAALVVALLIWMTRDALHHSNEMAGALSQSQRSEERARAGETKALLAKRRSDHLAAELRFAGALSQAAEGNVDRALFEMVEALRLAPEDATTESFRRAVRMNLTAWWAQTARLRFAFRLPGKMPDGPYPCAGVDARAGFVSAVGSKGTFVTFGPDLHIREWAFADGRSVGQPFRLPTDQRYDLPFSVSPDGRWLATWGKGSQWFALDTGDAAPGRVHHDSSAGPLAGEVTYPIFTTDPAVFVTSGDDPDDVGFYRFWDTDTKKEYRLTLRLGSGDGYRVIRGEDDTPTLIVARAGEGVHAPSHLEIWNLLTGKSRTPPIPLPAWVANTGGFVCLPRGESLRGPKWLDWNGLIHRWDLATGQPTGRAWQLPIATWYRFLTANDSVLVTHGRDTRVRLFDIDAGRQLGGSLSVPSVHVPDAHPLSLGLAVAPDGTTLVTIGRDGIVRGWDVKHLVGQATAARNQAPCHFPTSPTQTPAGSVVALSADGGRAFFGGADIGQIVDTRTGESVGPPRRHNQLNAAALSPDGTCLATATVYSPREEPSVVQIWDADGGGPVFTHRPPGHIHGLRFSPDGRLLAVGYLGGIAVLDTQRKQVRHTLREARCALDLAFSPDGHRLAVGYRGGYGGYGAGVRVWNLETGKPAGPLRNAWSWWSPAQPLGFVAGGDTVVVLDPDGRKLTRLDLDNGTYRAIDLDVQLPYRLATATASPFVAVSNGSGAIEIWDALKVRRHRVISSGVDVLQLQLSAEGKTLAAVCSDDSVRLWDTETGFPLGPPLYHPSPVGAVTFSRDGRELTAAVRSGRLYRWPLPEPMSGTAAECERTLETWLGITYTNGDGVLLAPEAWTARGRP